MGTDGRAKAPRPRTPSPSAPRGSLGESTGEHVRSGGPAASADPSPALTLWAASPTSESPTVDLPPLPTFPRRGRVPETPSGPSNDQDRFHIASWGSPYSGPTPESRTSSDRRRRRSLSNDTFDGDSPGHRFDLGHLLPSRVPELDLFEPQPPNSRVPSAERRPTPRASAGKRPATSPSHSTFRPEDNRLQEYFESRFIGEHHSRWSDISLSSDTESIDHTPQDNTRDSPLSKRKDILRALFNSSPSPEDERARQTSTDTFRRHKPKGSNHTVTQQDFWGTSTDFLSQARGKMMDSKYAVQASEPSQRPEVSPIGSNSGDGRGARKSAAASNPLSESKHALASEIDQQPKEEDSPNHASGYRFTEVADTMEKHAKQFEQPEERRNEEAERAAKNEDPTESASQVEDAPVTTTGSKDDVSPIQDDQEENQERSPVDGHSHPDLSAVDVDAIQESTQDRALQPPRVVGEHKNAQEESLTTAQEASLPQIAPIVPTPSPRPSVKVPWGKKTLTIRLPHDKLRGQEGGPPIPLLPREVAARVAYFEEQGFDTRGFVTGESDEYGFGDGSKQNRPIFPDSETVRRDAQQSGNVVRIPDPKEWRSYVDFLTEQKLRALGVSIGDEEPPVPPPGLSRQSSTQQYPPLPFSPPMPPSSGSSQQPPQPPHAFSATSIPEALSTTMSRKASIASPLSGLTPNNPRGQLHRQGSFPFSVQSQQGNASSFSSFSPQQQFASPLSGPRTGSPAIQHPFANRATNIGSPGPSSLDMQQLVRYPPAIQAELIAQMQRQQQQQLHAKLQQQQQLALNTKLPDFADDDLEEESLSAHPPLHTRAVDRDRQEIAVPRPRSHRHNLSAALEKDIPNAEYHLGKQNERQMETESGFQANDPFINPRTQRPLVSRNPSETRWNDAVQSIQVLNKHRQTRWEPDNAERPMMNAETPMSASTLGHEMSDELKTNPSEVDTNPDLDRQQISRANASKQEASSVVVSSVNGAGDGVQGDQAPQVVTKHRVKPSLSGLNVEAKEFRFNPSASFQPGNFSFSGANFQPPPTAKPPQPNYSRPFPQSQPEKSSFNISAPAFNPKGSFGSGPSIQSFNFSAPSFKPGAPEFKPSAPIEEPTTSGGEQPVADRIFTTLSTASSEDVVKQPKKNKAVQIVNPNLLPKPATVRETMAEDESGRLAREDDRQKRARKYDDDGDEVPQFAFPTHVEADLDAATIHPAPIVPSNDLVDKFEEVSLGAHRIRTPPAAAALHDTPTPVPSNAPTIDELRRRALDSIPKQEEQANVAIQPTTTDDPRQMSPAQAALHAVLGGKRHGHKSSLSATAKPFEFKPLSSDTDFPSFSGRTSEIIDSQNDSSQILSSPTQPLDSSIATTFRPSDSFFDQTASDPSKRQQPGLAPYPTSDNGVSYDDFEQPSLAEIDNVMRQLNENDDLGVEKEEPPSWEPPSPPFQADQPLLQPWKNMRSDAPSPSPNRPRPTVETENLEDETASHDPFSDSHAAVVDQSPVRRLNNERDVPISDWDDAFSSSDEQKLKAQVQSRSIFFEPHVEKVVAKAFQTKMDPMMTALLQLQDSMATLTAKNTVERRSMSASVGAESDADDEDDDEVQRPPRSRSRAKAFPTPELLNPDKIKSVMLEALQTYNTPPTPPAPGVSEFHEALVSLKSAVARSDAEKMQLEDIRAVMEETLHRRDSALVPHARAQMPYPEDDGQVMQLDKMLQDATVRAAEAVNHRNEIEDRAAETRKLLRLAEEELSLYKELDSDKEHSLRSVRDELSDLKEHLHDVQEHRIAAEKEHQSLTAKISSLEEEHTAMESTLEEYRESKRVWRQEIDDLMKEREALKSDVAILTSQVKEGVEKRDDMRDRLIRLQEDMARSAGQMASAKAHWHQQDLAHQTRAELLSVRIGDEARTRERLEKEIERLETQEKEHMKLRVLVDHTQQENTRLEDMVTTVKKELFEQQQLAARFEREFNDARETARVEVQRTRTSMEADIEAAHQQADLVRADLEADFTSMRNRWEGENSKLRTELDNIKMDADTAKEKHALLLEEAADAKRDALQGAHDSRLNAINELQQSHERRIAELQANHSRVIGNANEDKERSEKLLNERLGLADAKLEHYQDKIVHLEQKLEVAQSAAQAAVKAAQSAKAAPQIAHAAVTAAPAAAVPTSTAPVPEKVSPQALRESIMVLQEQLQERESRIEHLESELKATDTDAPTKLKERETEISWLRELLGVRVDDLSDLINTLSQPAYDPDTARDAAIRIRTNLKMEQQEKERLIAANIAPGQPLPVTLTGQQALASISNFASPKAAQLAAAFGNWRKGNGNNTNPSQLSTSRPGTSNSNSSTPLPATAAARRSSATPLRRPGSNASTGNAQPGWMSGLMTPPTSNLRKTPTPTPSVRTSPEKPRTPQRQMAGALGGARRSTSSLSRSPQTGRRQQHQQLTARQLGKQRVYADLDGDVEAGEDDGYDGVGGEMAGLRHPVTPPLMRKASYDNDAEDGEYSTAGFEGFDDDEEGEGEHVDGVAEMGERISPEPPRLKLDFGAPIGD
ncbi:MAG: hypothetical protein Q9157_002430 [Trypethelium eluteriae]